MLTYTTRRNLAGVMTSDSSAANLTVLDTLLNEADKEFITAKAWPFRQKTRASSTLTSNVHQTAADCGRLVNVTVTIGSTKYTPKRIKTRDDWDRLTQATNVTSNTPEYWFPFGKTYGFYPAPSSATASAITETYERITKDLSIVDYTTGTIVSITSGATTMTGSGTAWTSQMAGRYIRITDTSTANTGDGLWYEIASVTSATVLELVATYNGTSIVTGSVAYIIGQVSIIPEDFQMVPLYRALENYFTYIQPEVDRAKSAKINFAEGMKRAQIELGSLSI